MATKIMLTRVPPQAAPTVHGASSRRLEDSAISWAIPMTHRSALYLAKVVVNDGIWTVVVDTGSADFWLSCYFAEERGCDKFCTKGAKYTKFNETDVCVLAANATRLKVDTLEIKDYVIGLGQGGSMIPGMQRYILPSGAEGVLGLAYPSLAAHPNIKAGQFIDHLNSFSMYLTNSTGSFLMLNGVETYLIAKEKMKPFTVPIKENPSHWTIGMTAFQAGDDEVQFPCSMSALASTDDPTRCDSIVNSGTPLLSMPEAVFRGFVDKYLTGQGCEDARDLTAGSTKELYFCEASVTLPRLGFTFDDYTFYLTQKDYVTPVAETTKVLVELQSSGISSNASSNAWVLGTTFLKPFYASYEVNKSITFYCRDGDCAEQVVKNPIELQARKSTNSSKRSNSTISGASSSDGSGGVTAVADGGDVSSSGSSSTMTILAVVLGLIGAALLVGAFLFMRARKRRAAAASVASPGPVAQTPVAAAGAVYAAPAETPAERI